MDASVMKAVKFPSRRCGRLAGRPQEAGGHPRRLRNRRLAAPSRPALLVVNIPRLSRRPAALRSPPRRRRSTPSATSLASFYGRQLHRQRRHGAAAEDFHLVFLQVLFERLARVDRLGHFRPASGAPASACAGVRHRTGAVPRPVSSALRSRCGGITSAAGHVVSSTVPTAWPSFWSTAFSWS